MINRIHNIDKDILKKWLQIAKKNKNVVALYKVDNALKNTRELAGAYDTDGLLEFIRHAGIDNNKRIEESFKVFRDRFRHQSLRRTLYIDYWGTTVKRK